MKQKKRTKENRNFVIAHIGLLLVFALLSLVPFIPTEITGSSVLFFNVSDSNATITESTSEGTNVTEEVIAVFVNITNYSCSWDGINFTVCETVDWYNGSYAKGFISGIKPITQVEKQFSSTFTYCETTEKEGTKALHAYVFDANDTLLAKQIDKDVRCDKPNAAIENITVVENVTSQNITEPENITINETENITATNVTDVQNITNATEENITTTNITETNITQQNETVQVNVAAENATIIEEKLIQYQAVIGQPVKWKKIIKLENETINLEVNLPKQARILTVKEIENNQTIDITANVVTPIQTPNNLITGLSIFEEPNATSLTIEQPVQEIEIEYETEAPQVFEEYVGGVKRITISSETHYENVLTFTSIQETNQNSIRLYWIVNGTRVAHQIINYTDANNNGLVDQIYWITPHLSTQSFQVDITILNVQSFPKVGGNWTVQFNTTGTANLTITPINGTTYGNESSGDLEFLELKCGQTILSPIFNGSSVFYQDYSCNYINNHTAKVFTRGGHTLKFEFGNDTEYAFNLAGICGNTTACDCGDVVVSNRTLAAGGIDPIFNVACGGNGLDINTSGIELSCGGNTINGSNTGIGINFSRDTNRSTVTNCGIAAFDAGVHLDYNATNHYVINNNISYNDNVGINVTHEANGTNLTSNHVFRNRGDGIFISGYNASSLLDNVHNNTLNAFHIYNTSAVRIASPFANESARENGILFEFVNSTNLTDIAARKNNRSGIRLDNSSTGNRIELGSYEFNGLVGGLRNDFGGVDIDGNSTNNLIHNNTIQHNIRGLFVGKRQLSNNNSFLGNTFSNNSYAHVILNNSFNNTFRQEDYPNITIFVNSTVGQINFTRRIQFNNSIRLIDYFNISTVSSSRYGSFGADHIFANTSNQTGLNVTADIILKNSAVADLGVIIDTEDDGTFRECNSPECNEISFVGGTVIFNVTHFTAYEIWEVPPTGTSVDINTTDPTTNNTNANVTIYPRNFTDPSQRVTNISNWFRNGVSFAVLNMPFESNTTSNATNYVRDYSGLNNGTLGPIENGMPNWTNTSICRRGGCFTFVGTTSDLINITSPNETSFTSNSNFTVALWFNGTDPSTGPSDSERMITLQDANGTINIWAVYYVPETLLTAQDNVTAFFINGNGSGSTSLYSTPNQGALPRLLHFVVARFEALNGTPENTTANMSIWVNGRISASTITTSNLSIPSGSPNLYVGPDYTGMLDEILIFNRSLSAQEILYLNNSNGIWETIVAEETTVGENWSACVTPNDGIRDGTTVCTTQNVTILNGVPTITSVDINSTNPITNNTDTNITIYLRNVTDADSDQAQNISNWRVDGTSITVFNMPFETNVSSGTTNIREYSGLGANGTLSGNTKWRSTNGIRGGAYEFDETDAINTSADADLSFTNRSNFTIVAWVNLTNSRLTGATRNDIILSHTNATSATTDANTYEIYLQGDGTSWNSAFVVRGNVDGTQVENEVVCLSTTAVNRTSLVVARWETINSSSANQSIWSNGRICRSTTTSLNLGARTIPLVIGWDGYSASSSAVGFNGSIDEVLIFNRSLSAEQILELNRTNGTWETIVAQETGSAGENWSACVTPNDGTTDGTTVCSANLTISSSSCGDLSVSTTLDTNVTSIGTCFNFTASNIELDCAGYGITYGTVNAGNAVTANSRTNVTVRNCFMIDNSTTNARGIGVNFTSTDDSLIINNTIDTNGTTDNYGIQLVNSNRNQVVNNTIRTFGSGANNWGINVVTTSRDNNISGNTIGTRGTSANYGIRISTNSDRNVVSNANNITTRGNAGGGGSNFGIYVVTSSVGINITDNIINTSVGGASGGTGFNHGINLDSSANNTLVLNNTVTAGSTPSDTNAGLRATTKSFFNNFTHNRVSITGADNNYGIEFINNADISVAEYNNLTTNGTTAVNNGIRQTTSTGNNITNNVIFTNGSSNNEGIRLTTDSNNTIIDRNNITTTGTDSNNFGIYLVTRTARINVTNNVINTSGSSTNHGIDLEADVNNIIVLNNTINFGGSGGGGSTNSGIIATTRSFFNNLTHNRITGKGGSSDNYGIEFTTNANASTIEYNNISTNGTTTANYGITITSSTGNNITNNVIFTNGSSSNEGIRLTTNSNNTIINSNNITTTGSGASNFGISFTSTVVANNITNNVINTSGTAINYGISLTTNADNNTIDRNNITSGGSTTANHGIYLVLNSSNNNVTNNVINASGSGTIYGIAVENITEGNSMNRFDSNNISVSSAGSFGILIRAANDTIFNNTYIRNVPNWTSSARGNNNNSFENTTFANINGTINFISTFQFNGTRDITLALLNTTYNRSFVNSSSLTFLNTSATVRLYVPGLTNPKILLDTEDDGSYRGCVSSRCTFLQYASSVLTFNVSSWTSHAGADNSAPTITRVDINTTDPTTNNTNQNITIYPRNVTDTDADIVQNISNWFRDGSTITVFYMPFETNTNGTTNNATDYSGVGQNGTLGAEVRWINDASRVVRGGAYVFNGSSSATNFINVSADSDLSFTSNSNFTITAWFNSTDSRTAEDASIGPIVSHRNNSDTDRYQLGFNFAFNRLDFTIVGNTSSGSTTLSTATSSVARNRTHFVAAILERINSSSSNISIWVNGRTSASTTTIINLSARNKNMLIGAVPFSGAATGIFRGIIDEVIIFNQTLTPQQILYLNNSNGAWETIVAEETGSPGENWSACVTPNDGTTDGTTVCSQNLTVLGAPTVTLNNPPNGTINVSRSHVFNANMSSGSTLVNATLYHNLSGSWVANQTLTISGTANSTNFSVAGIVDGGYVWNVQTCDTGNSCTQASSNFTFTVNNPPRDVNLINPSNETLNNSNRHIFFSNASDVRGLANATLYHNINGTFAGNQTQTRNGTFNTSSFTVANIADGTYIWNIKWCDTDSNCSFSTNATGNFTFTVETTVPSNITLINPPNATNNRSNIHKFIANITDDSALDNATLYHNISGSFVANQTVSLNGTNNQTNFTVNLIADGGYTWYVLSCDTANNCNQSSSNFTFTVNNPPSGVNLTMPPNATINTSRTWQFQSNASDVRGLVNATLYHNISGSFVANQTNVVTGTNGVVTSFNVSLVLDGGYVWNALWCDGDSNCTFATSNSTFTVNTGPNATLNNPPNRTINASRSHVFNANFSDSKALQNATLYHNLSGSWTANQTVALNGTANSTNFSVAGIVDGGYVWNVQVCDTDNNCSQAPTNFTFTVNNPPRNITLINPPNGNENQTRTHIFVSNASDDRQLANATLYHNIAGIFQANTTVSLNGTNNQTSITVLNIPVGTFTWNVQWCDTDSNCTFASSNFTFIENVPGEDSSGAPSPAGAASRTQTIYLPKPPKPVKLLEELEPPKDLPPTPTPRFRIPREAISRTVSLQLPLKFRAIDWTVLLIIASLIIIALIRKQLQYLIEYRRRTAKLHKVKEIAQPKLKIKLHIFKDLSITLTRSVRILAISIESIFTALRVAIYALKRRRLKAVKLAALVKAHYVRSLEKAKRKLLERSIVEENLLSLEELRRSRLAGLHKLRKVHFDIRGRIESIQARLLSTAKLTLKEMIKLERSFRSQLPPAPELMPHPEVKEISAYKNDATEFTYLYNKVDEYIKSNRLGKAKETYDALLSIYNKLLTETVNTHELISVTKEIQSRLSLAILAAKAREKIKPYKPKKIELESEPLPPETKYDYSEPVTEEEIQIDYLHQLLKKNEYKKAIELFNSIYPEARKRLLRSPEKIKLPKLEKIKPHHPKETPRQEEDLRLSYLRELLRKNDYKEALKLYEEIYKEKRESLKKPTKLPDIKITPIPDPIKYDYEKAPSEEEIQIDYLHQLLKKNEYKKAIELFNSIYPEARKRPLAWPEKIKLRVEKLESNRPKKWTKEGSRPPSEEELSFDSLHRLLKKNDYKSAKKIYDKLFNKLPHKNDK